MNWKSLTKSWKTTLLGLGSLFLAAVQTYNAPSLQSAFHNPQVQIAMLAGALGLLAKDHDATGGTLTVDVPQSADVPKTVSVSTGPPEDPPKAG